MLVKWLLFCYALAIFRKALPNVRAASFMFKQIWPKASKKP